MELNSFYNRGFGWTCRQCESEIAEHEDIAINEHSRFYREGEAESKRPELSSALARWADAAQTILMCPRCGITEPADPH